MLVLFSGISGSGKNTIIEALLAKHENYIFFKSATTREKRENENQHIHLTKEEFLSYIESDLLFEHELIHENYYGVLKSSIDEVIENPDKVFIKDIDVKGAMNIKSYLSGKAKVITIFIDVDKKALTERLLKRGESLEEISLRLSRSAFEENYKNEYDYIVLNDVLEKAIEKADTIIQSNFKEN